MQLNIVLKMFFYTQCCRCSSSISSQQMQSCIKYKSKCVQPRFSLRYQIKKLSTQCTSESVFLYEINKSMKINAIQHQNYISRLSTQIPSTATVCRLFVPNYAEEPLYSPALRQCYVLCASHRALRSIMAGIVL